MTTIGDVAANPATEWQRRLSAMLDAVRSRSIPTATLISQAIVAYVEDGVVIFQFAAEAEYHRRAIDEPRNARLLRQALAEALGGEEEDWEVGFWPERAPLPVRLPADNPRRLREMPYSEYLGTHHWQQMRRLAHEHYGDSCVLCDAEPVDVHHRTYARRGSERLADLIVLCRSCHGAFHDLPRR